MLRLRTTVAINGLIGSLEEGNDGSKGSEGTPEPAERSAKLQRVVNVVLEIQASRCVLKRSGMAERTARFRRADSHQNGIGRASSRTPAWSVRSTVAVLVMTWP